jgi:hypothetical protein
MKTLIQPTVVTSLEHLITLCKTKHNQFNLIIPGMGVPENLKTIRYSNDTFRVYHHLAREKRNISPDLIKNTYYSQIVPSINSGNLICLN